VDLLLSLTVHHCLQCCGVALLRLLQVDVLSAGAGALNHFRSQITHINLGVVVEQAQGFGIVNLQRMLHSLVLKFFTQFLRVQETA